jgi:hypothetical protein
VTTTKSRTSQTTPRSAYAGPSETAAPARVGKLAPAQQTTTHSDDDLPDDGALFQSTLPSAAPATFHNACGVHGSASAYGRGSGWCPVHSLQVYKDGQDWLTDHGTGEAVSR